MNNSNHLNQASSILDRIAVKYRCLKKQLKNETFEIRFATIRETFKEDFYLKTGKDHDTSDLTLTTLEVMDRLFYKHCFKIGHDCAEMLMNTDLKDVPTSYLKMPFDLIRIRDLPENFFLNQILLFKHDFQHEEDFDKPSSLFSIACIDNKEFINLDTFYIYSNLTLFDCCELNEEVKKIYCEKKDLHCLENENLFDKKELRAFIFNFLLYVNQYPEDVKLIKKAGINIKKKIKTGENLYDVGSNLTIINKTDVRKIYSYDEPHTTTRKIDKTFWVRGHWRVLSHEKYKEKKLTWVKPHLKGIERNDLVSSNHLLKK